MNIIVPAMYPFPLIIFDADTETLTTIAELLMVIHTNGSNEALCWQMGDLDKSADKMPSDVFAEAMSDALGDCAFATTWAEQHHGLDWDESASFRPAWTKHMAASINKHQQGIEQMNITIPSMPTRIRPLPELEIDLDIPQLRTLANALGEIVFYHEWKAGLCIEVALRVCDAGIDRIFSQAVGHGMNRGVNNHRYAYIYQFLDENEDITLKELTAIRQAWAAHIARAIYEQIGA